jgi:hypothetical protein
MTERIDRWEIDGEQRNAVTQCIADGILRPDRHPRSPSFLPQPSAEPCYRGEFMHVHRGDAKMPAENIGMRISGPVTPLDRVTSPEGTE